MDAPLLDRLRARGFLPPDYMGRGLVNLATTVLDVLGARAAGDLPPLIDLDPRLTAGVQQIVVILADGLGLGQLRRLAGRGDMPYVASILDRAERGESAQLIEATTIFPSTTAAAITTLKTARTPQEHGNIAYFLWLDEFEMVTQMLRWGPAEQPRGSHFDDPARDPREYVRVPSIHGRLRARGVNSYSIEPEIFRADAMTRMHAAEAEYVGYFMPTTMGVRLRQLLEQKPWGSSGAYLYAYWSGIDTAAHRHGPNGPEHDAEAAGLDLNLGRALGDRAPGETLVFLTADHGHAAVDPAKYLDLHDDVELLALLRNPPAGEPRAVFLHTDHPAKVRDHLETRYPNTFFIFERDEAIAAGLFGRGDSSAAEKRVGEVIAMFDRDRAASIVRVAGQPLRQRGSHGGMTPDEMRIPILAWRV